MLDIRVGEQLSDAKGMVRRVSNIGQTILSLAANF